MRNFAKFASQPWSLIFTAVTAKFKGLRKFENSRIPRQWQLNKKRSTCA
ncbi:MAG: hypothetical protein SOY61_01800 [Campylobacter sp.]|nr:hypothetical protein [Campylobacter sp.]